MILNLKQKEGGRRSPSSFLFKKSERRAWFFLLLLLSGVLVLKPWEVRKDHWTLVVEHQETGEALASRPVEVGSELVFSWRHSVEHFRWRETFRITVDERLRLIDNRFEGFGAGIPHESDGRVRLEEGWVIFEPQNRYFEHIHWLHSHTALPEIFLDQELWLEGRDLPHHEPLRLSIKREVEGIWKNIETQ